MGHGLAAARRREWSAFHTIILFPVELLRPSYILETER